VSAAPAAVPALRVRSRGIVAHDAQDAADANEIWADTLNPKPFVNYLGAVGGTANYSAQSLMTSTAGSSISR
jgi:hypothetical protein